MPANPAFEEGLGLCERIQKTLTDSKAHAFLEQGDDSPEQILGFGARMMEAYSFYNQFLQRVRPFLDAHEGADAGLDAHALRVACVKLGALNSLPTVPSVLQMYPRQKQLGNAQDLRKTVAELRADWETRVQHVIEMLKKAQQHLEGGP